MTIIRKMAARRIPSIGILSVLAAIALLPACGGGSGGGGAATGAPIPPEPIRLNQGPGINSGLVVGKGSSISNPGSVIVNGVQFGASTTTAPAFRIGFGDVAGTEADVHVGMVVTMRGSFLPIETVGTYDNVLVEPQVIGPAVGGGNPFAVLNQTVNVTRFTVFEGIPAVSDGDAVEVHGFFTGPNTIEATHIRLGTANRLQLRGVVTTLDGGAGTLSIGAQQVSFTPPAPAGVAVGRFVEVEGVPAGAVLDATGPDGKVELLGFVAEADKEIEIEGSVQSHDNVGKTFVLRGPFGTDNVAYDTAFATRFELEARNTLSDAATVLAVGAQVEVEGRLIGGTLQAREIELRRSENVVLEGNVSNLQPGPTFTLQPFDVSLNAAGALIAPPGAQITNDAHVEVGGNVPPGSSAITVTRVTVITDPLQANAVILQGPVTSHTDNTMTILGISVDTVGLQEEDDPLVGPSDFENAANRRVTKTDFFSLLQDGVTVVKAKAQTGGVTPPFEPGTPPLFHPRSGVEIQSHR